MDLPPAGPLQRVGAGALDMVIYYSFLLVTFGLIVWFFPAIPSTAVARGILIIISASLMLFIPTTVEALTHGRSLGKIVMGMRVVRADNGPIVWRHSFTRWLMGLFEIWICAGGIATALVMFTHKSQRFGDLAAGTHVITERVPLVLPRPVQAPPALLGWAQNADITGISGPTAMSMRSFFERQNKLSLQTRTMRATEYAKQIRNHVLPPPPEGVPDLVLIASFLAERTRRATVRLEREEKLRSALFPPDATPEEN